MATASKRLSSVVAERLQILAPNVAARQLLVVASRVPASTFQRMLKGTNEPQASNLMRIAQAANVSMDWLTGLTDENDRAASISQSMITSADSASAPEGFVMVPMLQVTAAAGRGRFTTPDDLTGGDMVGFREVWLRTLGLTPGRTHILWAVGDSMNPTISDGDMLLIDRMIDKVLDDGIYVVVVGGGVVVKRIQLRHNGSVVLKSDNDRYDEQIIPPDEVPSLVVEGRVRWVGGPI